ncbi:hypothetical protein ACFFQW_08915 [Umezawaea endophytica]|uniref:Uncharacterized protein n=1 Tax=Umezawaea endophytica TaxID=1654476 RepID=A0A9X2VHC4_9PSEU|nr:hypothetical protein [Umezawaea endophytica]MCS7476107.1 hypothetical protein [Umezawaea endophytica]
MNLDRQLFPALLACAVLLPAGIGLGLGWPPWLWILLSLAVLGALLTYRRTQLRQEEEQQLRRHVEVPAPRVEVVTSSSPLAVTPLSSAKPDYDFLFACTMKWRPAEHGAGPDQGDPRSVVADNLLGRAAATVARESPGDLASARHRLSAALAQAGSDRSGRYLVWAEDVSLVVPEADAIRLRQLADLRKREELWEHERDHERNVRAYLGEDVLKDTGTAVVWWLAKHTEQVTETVGLIGALARLSAAANNTEVVDPSQAPQPVVTHNGNGSSPDHVHRYLPEFEESHAVFGHQLSTLLRAHEEQERAQNVEDSYNPGGEESVSGDLDEPDLD